MLFIPFIARRILERYICSTTSISKNMDSISSGVNTSKDSQISLPGDTPVIQTTQTNLPDVFDLATASETSLKSVCFIGAGYVSKLQSPSISNDI